MSENIKQQHRIEIINRKSAFITGIQKMLAITETQISLETMDTTLQINGSGLHATRLSVESGELFVEGEITAVKYMASKQKGGLIKRIFK